MYLNNVLHLITSNPYVNKGKIHQLNSSIFKKKKRKNKQFYTLFKSFTLDLKSKSLFKYFYLNEPNDLIYQELIFRNIPLLPISNSMFWQNKQMSLKINIKKRWRTSIMLSKRKKFDNRIQMVDTNTIAISVPYWEICKPNSGRIQHLIDLIPLPPLPIAHLILTHSLLYIIRIHHPFRILNVDINKKIWTLCTKLWMLFVQSTH